MREVRQGVAQIDHFGAQRLLARIGQQLTDQGGGTVGILIDLHEITEIGVALIVPQEQEVAMP